MCSGHVFGVLWIDLEDQRRAGACFWDAWGVLGGPLEVPWGPGCFLVGPWASLEALGASWDRPGGPWGEVGGLGRSLGQSWEINMLVCFLDLGGLLRCHVS